jgi:hypothetical protein
MHMRPDIRCRCCAAFAVLFLVSAWIPANAQDANADLLVGHWRKTTIESGPVDENLILRGDGAAARWIVTANIRTAVEGGAWQVEGKTLTILLPRSPFMKVILFSRTYQIGEDFGKK